MPKHSKADLALGGGGVAGGKPVHEDRVALGLLDDGAVAPRGPPAAAV